MQNTDLDDIQEGFAILKQFLNTIQPEHFPIELKFFIDKINKIYNNSTQNSSYSIWSRIDMKNNVDEKLQSFNFVFIENTSNIQVSNTDVLILLNIDLENNVKEFNEYFLKFKHRIGS